MIFPEWAEPQPHPMILWDLHTDKVAMQAEAKWTEMALSKGA